MTRHLSQEQLLRHLDGELSKFAMWKTTKHLQACRSCQVESDRLKEQIAAILDAQNTIFGPSMPPPPNPWPRIEPRLDRAMRLHSAPWWKRLVPFAGGAPRLRFAYSAAALALMLLGFSVWMSVTPVSAQEVLARVAAADAQRLAITPRQVVRQKVHVRRTTPRSASTRETGLESWKSVRATYWKSSNDALNADLLERYKANGLASILPLSAPAAEAWVKIAGAKPSTSQNGESISVQVVSTAEGQARGLEEVSFHVRSRDWRLDEMALAFDDATYQITEEESSIVARSEVPRDVLAALDGPEETSGGGVASQRKAEGTRVAGPGVNLDDLEMTVRSDLHSIGADLGESIEVTPRPPDSVVVDARGGSPQMKESVRALLQNRRGIQLEFQDPDGSTTAGRVATKKIPQAGPSPVLPDRRLAVYFGSAEAQENYTRLLLEAGNNILARLHALRNLASRWPPDQEIRLSATASNQMESMVRDHAREILRASLGLKKELQPLMKNFGYPLDGDIPARSGMKWQEVSASGLDTAQRVDQVLRSLLTTSASPLSLDDALPRLQQGLRELERAARELPSPAE